MIRRVSGPPWRVRVREPVWETMNPSSVHSGGVAPLGQSHLSYLLLALQSRLWLLIAGVCLGAVAAGLYWWKAPRTYAAAAVVRSQAEQLTLLPLGAARSTDVQAQLANAKRMLLSSELLRRVAETQQLAAHPRFGGGAVGNLGVETAVAALRRCVNVDVPERGDEMTLTVLETDANTTARLANALADELLAAHARSREDTLKEVSGRLEEALRKSQQDLVSQAPPSPAAPDGAEAVAARQRELLASLNDLNQRLVAAGLKRLQLASEAGDAARAGTNVDLRLYVPSVATAPAVASVRSTLLEKQIAFETLAQRYKERHPRYVEAQEELARLRGALAETTAAAVDQLRSALQSAEEQEAALSRQYETVRAEIETLNRRPQVGTNTAEARKVAISQELHDQIMRSLKEITVAGDLFASPLRISQRATPPLTSVAPDLVTVFRNGLLGGFLAGFLACLVLGLRDTSFRWVDETEATLNLSVLGVIPRLKPKEKGRDAELAAAEGFRALRTSISVTAKGKDPRTLLFTSTCPEEGKTFCALNFAVGLAQQGLKAVLVECDLRRPMAAPSLPGVKADAHGVSDYLKSLPVPKSLPPGAGPAPGEGFSFAELQRRKSERTAETAAPAAPLGVPALTAGAVVQPTQIKNLFFVTAGTPSSNPTELLARDRFEHFLTELLQHHDRVVLDSPPVLGISETLLLASRVQGVCFVVAAGKTPRRAVLRAVEILRRGAVPLLGVVLNGLPPGQTDPYGQSYYYRRTQPRPSSPSKS